MRASAPRVVNGGADRLSSVCVEVPDMSRTLHQIGIRSIGDAP